MRDAKRYELDADAAFNHFLKTIDSSNELSRTVLGLDLKKFGCFFTILSNAVNVSNIHKFDQGGIGSKLREKAIEFLLSKLLGDNKNSIVFDDVLESYEDLIDYDLFVRNGLYCNSEAYYLIKSTENPDFSLLEKCLQASDAEWHCLAILTRADLTKSKGKEINTEIICEIVSNANMIMTTAYDGEGYIFWEKTSPSHRIPN